MPKRFIYVFSKNDRDSLIKSGYTLLKNDEANCIFVFENSAELSFSVSDVKSVESDVLSF